MQLLPGQFELILSSLTDTEKKFIRACTLKPKKLNKIYKDAKLSTIVSLPIVPWNLTIPNKSSDGHLYLSLTTLGIYIKSKLENLDITDAAGLEILTDENLVSQDELRDILSFIPDIFVSYRVLESDYILVTYVSTKYPTYPMSSLLSRDTDGKLTRLDQLCKYDTDEYDRLSELLRSSQNIPDLPNRRMIAELGGIQKTISWFRREQSF
jgi:hypothetical protein